MKRYILVTLMTLTFMVTASAQNGQSPPKKVVLNFTQSTTAGVTANGEYRATVSGGPYTNLAVSSTPVTSFTDTTVQPGNTYYYVVTAKVGPTDESANSNEAKAVIPLATAPPSGLNTTVQ